MREQRYKLSEKERVFLIHTGTSADLTPKEIAARSGLREHSIRDIQHSLLGRGLIQPVYFVDMYRLGLIDLGLFFSRGAESTASRRVLEQKLRSHPRVTWFAKMAGAYQYAVSVALSQMNEIEDFYETILTKEEGAYFKRTIRIGFEWHSFAPTFLLPQICERKRVILSSTQELESIDETDVKILQTVAELAGRNMSEMARALRMSPSSFTYRFNQLRERGIIAGMGYVMAAEKLGIHLYRVLIVDRCLTRGQKAQLMKLLSEHPCVGAIKKCMSSWDFEIRFETEHPEEVDAFAQMLYDSFGAGIDSITPVQQFRVLKRRALPGELTLPR